MSVNSAGRHRNVWFARVQQRAQLPEHDTLHLAQPAPQLLSASVLPLYVGASAIDRISRETSSRSRNESDTV